MLALGIFAGFCLVFQAAAQVTTPTASITSNPILLEDIETIVAFGDSYSSTYYDPRISIDPLSPNQTFATISGGYVWLNYLAQKIGVEHRMYNFAKAGSTISPHVKIPDPVTGVWGNVSINLVEQIDLFHQNFVNNSKATWDPRTTLFAIASGINDIQYILMGQANYTDHVEKIAQVYTNQLTRLYNDGARQFLLATPPPFQFSPGAKGSLFDDDYAIDEQVWIKRLQQIAQTLQTNWSDANIRIWDLNYALTQIITNASEYGFTVTNDSCVWYLPRFEGDWFHPNRDDEEHCEAPLSKYIWIDPIHVTWAVHVHMGNDVIEFLSGNTPAPSPVARLQRRWISLARRTFNFIRSRR